MRGLVNDGFCSRLQLNFSFSFWFLPSSPRLKQDCISLAQVPDFAFRLTLRINPPPIAMPMTTLNHANDNTQSIISNFLQACRACAMPKFSQTSASMRQTDYQSTQISLNIHTCLALGCTGRAESWCCKKGSNLEPAR